MYFAYAFFIKKSAVKSDDNSAIGNDHHTFVSTPVSESKYAVYNPYGHVRLQDLSLSYNLSKFASKIGVRSARFTLSGRNLFYFAPGWKMSDPENRSGYGIGIPRAVTLGLNVTL